MREASSVTSTTVTMTAVRHNVSCQHFLIQTSFVVQQRAHTKLSPSQWMYMLTLLEVMILDYLVLQNRQML